MDPSIILRLFDLAVILGLAVIVFRLIDRHEAERREWARERQALLERIAGVSILPVPEQTVLRAYTDEEEWTLEQERLGH